MNCWCCCLGTEWNALWWPGRQTARSSSCPCERVGGWLPDGGVYYRERVADGRSSLTHIQVLGWIRPQHWQYPRHHELLGNSPPPHSSNYPLIREKLNFPTSFHFVKLSNEKMSHGYQLSHGNQWRPANLVLTCSSWNTLFCLSRAADTFRGILGPIQQNRNWGRTNYVKKLMKF